MIDNIQPSHQETVVPMKNFTEGFTTLVFGNEPPVFNASGVLLHSEVDNWSETFFALYLHVLRASKLAVLSKILKKDLSVIFKYHNKKLDCSIISFNKTINATAEQGVRFNMQLLVKKIIFNWEAYSGTDLYAWNRTGQSPTSSTVETPNKQQDVLSNSTNTVRGNPALTIS
jgi:hypothetical protein